MNVETAVVPIAGLGTRLLPLTHLVAKEFLPVGNMPAIQLIVEELIASGIRRFIFVTSSQKPPVEPLFASAEFSQKYADRNLEFCSVIQTEQLGLGDAIRCATNLIDGPFLVALGDCLLGPTDGSPFTRAIVENFENQQAEMVLGFQKVPTELTGRYGIAKVGEDLEAGSSFIVKDLVEKPDPKNAPSNFAICGRYCFSPSILTELDQIQPGKDGEIQLTDAISNLIGNGRKSIGVLLPEHLRRFDIGNIQSYVQTFIEFAASDPDLAATVKRAISRSGASIK